MRLERGCLQVYTGDGKGKTTCALGLALRAAGSGLKSVIIQFMKGRTDYGELKSIARIPEIKIHQFGTPELIVKGKERPVDYEEAAAALKKAAETMENSDVSILVLDEINVALYFELIKIEDVIRLIEKRPKNMELVLTGRRVPQEIIDRADLVTEMREIKHYFNTINLPARKGIEF